MSDDQSPYRIKEEDGLFKVERTQYGSKAYTVLELRDRRSADQYLSLLKNAWQAGYKAGFKQGKGV